MTVMMCLSIRVTSIAACVVLTVELCFLLSTCGSEVMELEYY